MDVRSFDCVIAFSFGSRQKHSTTVPGLSNDDLALQLQHHFTTTPKVLQWEVADAYATLQPDEAVIRIEQNPAMHGRYMDTRAVAEAAASAVRSRGWTSVALVAHPDHVRRVQRVCKKLGLETSDQQVMWAERQYVRYDRASEQRWTRSHWRFAAREWPTKIYYRLRGFV